MKEVHAFIGLSPAIGLIPEWERFQTLQSLPRLRFTPWYKMHLTLFFWPGLTSSVYNRIFNLLQKSLLHSKNPLISTIKGFDYFEKSKVLFLKETSEQIQEFYQNLMQIIEMLPEDLRPQSRKNFIPHWTIARKFHPAQLQRNSHYFQSLDQFKIHGTIPAVSFFRTLQGRYSPRHFQSLMNQ